MTNDKGRNSAQVVERAYSLASFSGSEIEAAGYTLGINASLGMPRDGKSSPIRTNPYMRTEVAQMLAQAP